MGVFKINNLEIKKQLLQEVKDLQSQIHKKLDYLEVANQIIKLV